MPVYRLFSFSVLFILNTDNASSFAIESMPYQAVTIPFPQRDVYIHQSVQEK